MKKEIWTEEDELEFLMGDMNGIAFEEQEEPVTEESKEAIKKILGI